MEPTPKKLYLAAAAEIVLPATTRTAHGQALPCEKAGSGIQRFFRAGALALIFCLSSAGASFGDEVASLKIKKITTFNHIHTVGLSWSADGRYLMSAALSPLQGWRWVFSNSPMVAVWDIKTLELMKAYRTPGGPGETALLGHQPVVLGRYPESPGWSNRVSFSIWEMRTGNIVRHIPGNVSSPQDRLEQRNAARALSYSFSGQILAITRSQQAKIFIYDTNDWREYPPINTAREPYRIALSPDGKHIAYVLRETVHVVDLETQVVAASLQPSNGPVHNVSWSRDGAKLSTMRSRHPLSDSVWSDGDDDVKIWDTTSWKLIGSLPGSFGGGGLSASSAMSWSYDGRYIATVSNDGVVRIWNAKTHEFLTQLVEKSFWGAIFSPTENLLASSGYDGVNIYSLN